MKKVTKNTIKSIIRKQGYITVYMLPCKTNINNIWIQPHQTTVDSIEGLEKEINIFSYYNCNNELGKYPSYYIEELEK
jgi:hypothetical protein